MNMMSLWTTAPRAGEGGRVTLIPRPAEESILCLASHREKTTKSRVWLQPEAQRAHQNLGASTAQLDRFALIVPDELLHFLANVSPSAIGKERNEGKSLPPWRCHFHTLRLAACQQTGHSKEVEWTLGFEREEEQSAS
ncbi:hypothetical protein UPYG_G00116030 [Umbra pygmaea]|uniref:Uncharacterized protein n=1 Tax=Umbra pygmaea TaxID=75934 RepID=A0ABD0X3V2_UMBPY